MPKSRIRRMFMGDLSAIWLALFMPVCTLPDFLVTMPTWEAIRLEVKLTGMVLIFAYLILLITEPLDD